MHGWDITINNGVMKFCAHFCFSLFAYKKNSELGIVKNWKK